MSFTKAFAGANPLPQVLTIASTGTAFNFTAAASTTTGGAWLSIASGSGCILCTTPEVVSAIVNPNITLVAGNYSGQIVVTSQSGAVSLTVPVTLTVASTTGPFLDNLPGQLTFSLKTAGTSITSQDIQVRNGGPGSLAWTAAATTSDGGNWLTVSATSGTAPSFVTVGVTVANLPSGGLIAGSFIGQLAFQGNGTAFTIPVSVVVGDNVFRQLNPISFVKPFGGANPLPQTLMVTSTGANFNFTRSASTATGGDWLSVTSGSGCILCTTPESILATVNPIVTLAPGTYTGQIVVTSQTGNQTTTVPVILTIAASGSTFFDNLPGQMSFALKLGGTGFAGQDVQVRNGGAGSLDWTVTGSTSDGGNWLTFSPASGTAPSYVTARVSTPNLPGGGLLAGTFVGQLVFQSAGVRVTVPVSVQMNDNVFSQINAINFSKVFAGADPLPQTLMVPSTGTNFNLTVDSATSTGGSWLSVSSGSGCNLCTTPETYTVKVTTSPTMPVGTYTGQIVFTSQSGSLSITVPVTLAVNASGATFFDSLPGQMTYYLKTSGTTITSQDLEIRNGGSGSLSWTATGSTSDGANWLTLSASSGTAPSVLTAGVSVANLPGGGLLAGTFIGEIVLQTAGSRVTVPVSVIVGDSIFNQVNGINFTKPFGGANPLYQTLTISSKGTNFNFTMDKATATGGNWLTIASGSGCNLCTTPETITATVSAGPTLAAGVYTGEIIVTSQNGSQSITIPVTLTVSSSGAFFDNLPGQVSFSILTGSGNPPAQSVQVRNGGSGPLNWTVTASTSDGGNWLSVSPPSGATPSAVSVSVTAGALPNQGLIAGTFTGNLVFQSAGGRITIPVSVSVGASVFVQVGGLTFTKAFGAANPLAQTFTAASTGTNFNFTTDAVTGTGGNWLTASNAGGCNLCTTPKAVTATIVAAPTLAAGVYTGQIVVTSQSGNMAMTVPVTLTVTGGPAPSTPTLLSPGNGATGVSTAPTLTWTAATGADSYDVYLGASSTPPFLANTTATNFPATALAANTQYFWRVVAKNSAGSTSSTVFSFTTSAGPVPVSIVPGGGSGLTQTFTITYSSPAGFQNLGVVDLLVNRVLDGRQACYIAFVPSGPNTGSVFLVDDGGDAGGPYAGMVLPTAGSVANSQCSIAGTGSSVNGSGNTLTLTLAITFKPAFAGNRVLYLSAQDLSSNNSGWYPLGTWNVPGGAPSGPAVTSMIASRSDGHGQTYTFNFSDSNGFADISVVNVLLNSAIDGRQGCYIAFAPASAATGSLFLVDDAGDAGGPFAGSLVLPGNGAAQNSRCSINGAGSSVSASGNNLTLTLAMTFTQLFNGNQIFFLAARNNNATSDWQPMGSVTIH